MRALIGVVGDTPIVTTAEETAELIRSMRIRGAGRIARAGASALGDFADTYTGGTLEGFLADLKGASDTILASRPTAVSLWNGLHATVKGASEASSLEEARALVSANAKAFCERSERAVEEIARIGARRIQDGDVIMTHCNSSAALGVIKEAHRQGKDIRVYATESRPWRQGILTVNDLADAGVDVTLIIDSAVRSVMRKVDKVFVGADTVTSQGALINKVGTSQLALAAHEARVHLYACAETYKFSPMTMFGDAVTIEERDISEVVRPGEVRDSVKIFNPVFDSTPAAYIDAIVTELGMMSPGSVYDVMVRQLGDGIFSRERFRWRAILTFTSGSPRTRTGTSFADTESPPTFRWRRRRRPSRRSSPPARGPGSPPWTTASSTPSARG